MRPVRLEIEGFTCFRERQIVAFEGMSLFAIAGPTGAGKSSLLDAMVLALYGYVPRIGRQGLSELVSLGEDRASVLFEFEVGTQLWRVARVLRRSGSSWAQLERIDASGTKGVADKVREVDTKIAAILGLGCEAFLQSVLLPQGKFSAFLQSSPGGQQEILTELLRLRVYERMRARAEQERQRQETELDTLTRRLEEDFADATPLALEQAEATLVDARGELARARAALPLLAEQARTLRAQLDRWKEVDQLEAAWERHRVHRDAIEALRRTIDAAQRASRAWPVLCKLREVQGALQVTTQAVVETRVVEEQATQLHQGAQTAALQSQQRAIMLPSLRERSQCLSEAIGWSSQRGVARGRAERHRLAAEQASSQLAGVERALQTARERALAVEARLLAARRELDEIVFNPDELAQLEPLRQLAQNLTEWRRQLSVASQTIEARSDQRRKTEQELERREGELQEAERRLEVASRTLQAAHGALRMAEHAEMAHVLREEMEPGVPCPVCFHTSEDLPQGTEPTSVTEARSTYEQASLRVTEAERRTRAAQERDADARTRLDLAKDEETRAEWSRLELQLQMSSAEQVLDAMVPGEGRAEERLEREIGVLARQKDARQAAVGRVLQAEKDQVSALAQHDRLLEQSNSASTAMEREGKLRAEALREAEQLELRLVEAGVGLEDPSIERQRIEARIEAIVREERSATAALASARAADEVARVRHQGARERLEGVERQVGAAERELDEAMVSAGFTEAAMLEEALLPEPQIHAGLEQIRSCERAESTLSERLASVREGLGTERISEDEVVRADAAHERGLQVLEAAIGREATATHVWGDLAERVSRSLALTEQREGMLSSVRRYRRLATDLRANGFPAWLLSSAFSALVAGASARLKEFTGRYTLCWDAQRREIGVVDHDNADEVRRAETLSGGETFLASLALALELSEQVQRAAGSVRLDSLFIDEGFGTLDPETLEAVAGAIEALSASNRMVGIITHVGSLTERLPTRLEVNRRPEGSAVVRVA